MVGDRWLEKTSQENQHLSGDREEGKDEKDYFRQRAA